MKPKRGRHLKTVFWNIKGKPENIRSIIEYGKHNNIDVILLCECSILSGIDTTPYVAVKHVVKASEFEVLVNTSTRFIYTREKKRYCILQAIGSPTFNLVLIHLNSEHSPNAENIRASDIQDIKEELVIEEEKNDKKSLIVGDFNINILDKQMIGVDGFNAKLFRYQVERGYQTIHGKRHEIFYNPMLKLYRDIANEKKPKGTYFYKNASPEWFCYDHILLRQSMLNYIDCNCLRIVDRLSDTLIKNHRAKETYSDHLPLYFEIKQEV